MVKPVVAIIFAMLAFMLLAGPVSATSPGACENLKVQKVREYKLEEGKTLPFVIKKRLSRWKGNARRGLKLFTNREKGNCIACHAVKSQQDKVNPEKFSTVETYGNPGNIGPSLDAIGKKYTSGELRVIIVDAKIAFPTKDTTMPAYYKQDGLRDIADSCVGKTILSGREIEDLVKYLGTLK
ncbi:MAG: c-type cytochrome [Methyloligellaceae bacterium]